PDPTLSLACLKRIGRLVGRGQAPPLVAHRCRPATQLASGAQHESQVIQAAAPAPGYRPRSFHSVSTRAETCLSMTMGVPHSRTVSPGHLLVASKPIFPPSPDTGEAKSR